MIIKRLILLLALTAVLTPVSCLRKIDNGDRNITAFDLKKLFNYDEDFKGYEKTYGPTIYDRETIFDYLDGGAEIYLSLNFRELLNFELEEIGKGKMRIIVDVYDMKTKLNSEEILEIVKSGKEISLDKDKKAYLSVNMIEFSQREYFVRVQTYSSVDPNIIKRVASTVSSAIVNNIPK